MDHEPKVVCEFAEDAGVPIEKVLSVAEGYFVLLDRFEASKTKTGENLAYISGDGGLIWRIAAPGSSDTFTDIELREGALLAGHGSGAC